MNKILNKYEEVEANRAETELCGLTKILIDQDGSKRIVVNADEKAELEKLGYKVARMGDFDVYIWGKKENPVEFKRN